MRAEPGLLDLPERLSLFGLTRLPASYLDVLAAIAAGRDVHLFLLHPSPALWDRASDQAGPASRLHRSAARTRRRGAPRNPLLASWGRDAREMQLVLGGAVAHGVRVPDEDGPGAMHSCRRRAGPDSDGDRSLLGRLQEDVRFDLPPAGRSRGGRRRPNPPGARP